MRLDCIWIVEINFSDEPRDKWEATIGAGLDREHAREVMKKWQERNPLERFRVRRYYRGKR